MRLFGPGRLHYRRRAGQAVAGLALVTLPTAPTWRFHPGFSTMTTSGGRVTQMTDLIAGYAANEGSSGLGPKLSTDALGRRFLRFEREQWMDIPSAPASNARAFAFFMVGRVHFGSSANMPIASIKGAATGKAHVNVGYVTNAAPFLSNGNVSAAVSTNSNAAKGITGSQLQVIGVVSRTTANGGTRLYINNDVNTAAQNNGGTATGGWELARYNSSPGVTGAWGAFDAYDIIEYDGTLTNAQADAMVAALVSGFAIPQLTDSIVFEGDSITYGLETQAGAIKSGDNVVMSLTNPGDPYCFPGNWRVVNSGVSGNNISNLVTRRDLAFSMFDTAMKLAGRNVAMVQIGANDFAAASDALYPGTTAGTAARGDAAYTALVAYLNTTTTGVLQRGFEVRQAVNIAIVNAARQTSTVQYRTRIRAAAFLTDVLAGSGQTYDGKVARLELPLVAVGGQTVFDTSADAASTTYYQSSDGVHPNAAGMLQMRLPYFAGL